MSLFEAILLGIIQGISEFVPVSSSGHLLLVPDLFNLTTPDLTLIAVSHIATILAVIIYFRRDLWQIVTAVIEGCASVSRWPRPMPGWAGILPLVRYRRRWWALRSKIL
jgi:undecaprenyl pyrophosphate phosphatase UppP